jgi:hypothetical protein
MAPKAARAMTAKKVMKTKAAKKAKTVIWSKRCGFETDAHAAMFFLGAARPVAQRWWH